MPAHITEEEAVELLKEDLEYFEQVIQDNLLVRVNDNQYAALVSFVFNIGEGNLRQSTLLKKVNNNNMVAAANEFDKWVFAKGEKLPGLMRRREAEKQLFITMPAPASIEQKVMSIGELLQNVFAEPEKVAKANIKLNPQYMNGVAVIALPVFVSWTPGEDDDAEVADDSDAVGTDGNGEGRPTGPVPVP
jgi:hypothetical protein